MKLGQLPKMNTKKNKRVGRGHGSGRGGHTSGRGAKGQKARSEVGLLFEGTKFKKSLIKRLPLYRGKNKFRPSKRPSLVVNLKYLQLFKKDEEVSLKTLQEKGIISKDLPKDSEVKILGEGELSVSLTILLPVSKSARVKIEKAGGKVLEEKMVKTKKEVPIITPVEVQQKRKVPPTRTKVKAVKSEEK